MIKNNTADLISFLEKSVSPYHTTAEAIRLMDESGFTALEQNKPWKLEKGGNYYVKCFGTMLIAFHVGCEYVPGEDFRLAACHVDWPCYYKAQSRTSLRRLRKAQHRALRRHDSQHMA